MRCKNLVSLIGYVGNDPEFKEFESGCVCNVSLATSEKYKDKSGELVEETQWHNLVFWGKTAEFVNNYIQKGNRISIEGKIKQETWEQDGDTKYKTVIVVKDVITFDYSGDSESNSESKAKSKPKARSKAKTQDNNDW